MKPFETGGDAQLEHLGRRADAALFAVGTSTKKRPHNLTLGALPSPSPPRLSPVLHRADVASCAAVGNFTKTRAPQLDN